MKPHPVHPQLPWLLLQAQGLLLRPACCERKVSSSDVSHGTSKTPTYSLDPATQTLPGSDAIKLT